MGGELLMPSSDVRGLLSVVVHQNCPKCGARAVERSSEAKDMESLNGAALFDLSERCIMCGWLVKTRNVKIGA